MAAAPLAYRVVASKGAEVLDVEVRGATVPLTLDAPALPYATVTSDGGTAFRYRFRLGDAARELDSRKWAFADGDGLYAAPSTWLMRPDTVAPGDRFTLEVLTEPGTSFVTGLHRASPDAGTYEGPVWALGDAPWSGFAPFTLLRDELTGAVVETAIAKGKLTLTPEQVRAWVRRSVALVGAYYGRFPVPRVAVMVLPCKGDGICFGTAMGNGGAAVLVWLGADADVDTVMKHDWVLPHELTHFALPNLSPRYSWLEEGAATYVEPVVRTRRGELSVDAFWRQMLEKLPLGLPEKGDRGLDRTPTWGRTYWGGALFLFVADVELRKKGSSLDAALKGIVAAGGTQEVRWELEQTLAAGDAATRTHVLTALHQKLGAAPGDVDLPALFKQLGVALVDGQVRYDERAPLAKLRRELVAPEPK
ncbi:MAG: hypothetical protein IPJ65_22520 [Archangiaceae bacterium]|nr:hypothetical protein [Archangiaceae bacterium]